MKHPWLKKFPVKKDTKYLIIGTHPPMPYCGRLKFYYGNMGEFWKFLDKVYPNNNLYNDNCPKIKDVLHFLNFNKISITDMVEETDGKSFSIDNDMNWLVLNTDLKKYLINGSIETIYFTSFGGKNSALSLFKKWLKLPNVGYKDIKIPDCKFWRDKSLKIKLDNKIFTLKILFSPSPTARRNSTRISEFKKWKSKRKSGTYDDFRVYWYKSKLPKL